MLDAPIAKKINKQLTTHNHTRIDPYYWMNDRENPEVIDYIKAENNYLHRVLAHTQAFQETLFHEMKGRIKEQDESVPYQLGDYLYYYRYEEGQEYPIYGRKKVINLAKEAYKTVMADQQIPEQIILNVNELAEGYEYFIAAGLKASSNHQILGFATDTVGRRIFTLQFKDLETGELLSDRIENTTGNYTWANDNQTIFYTRQHAETLRPYQVYRHKLGTDSAEDVLVFTESDESFWLGLQKSKSKDFIFIASQATISTEYYYLDANQPTGDFMSIQARERDLEYFVDQFEDHFYILTNDQAKNFRLVRCPILASDKANWEELIPHRSDVLLENIEIFRDFLVVEERKKGLSQLRIIRWDDQSEHYLDFGEPTYTASIGYNPDFDTEWLRYSYNSLTTPKSTYDYQMKDRTKLLQKQQEIRGGFHVDDYQSERIFATTQDGTSVPISIVYRKDLKKTGNTPLYLTAYGSYGLSYDPYFSAVRLSLLDRGFIFAIAHIRGGQEMGRYWYEEGKLLYKKNTFQDFIDCAEHLIAQNYTNRDQLVINGGSAGGLLMGAVMNMRPELFKVVVADVPFVDVLTTMLDDSIPLTTGEYDEWGNPNEKAYYDYMLSYSPYDQVTAKDYPHLLVTSGLHDSQVQYWEPTKWVAKLRTLKTNQNLLLLHTNMDAGHTGSSGRFQHLKEVAREYAFIFHVLGKALN